MKFRSSRTLKQILQELYTYKILPPDPKSQASLDTYIDEKIFEVDEKISKIVDDPDIPLFGSATVGSLSVMKIIYQGLKADLDILKVPTQVQENLSRNYFDRDFLDIVDESTKRKPNIGELWISKPTGLHVYILRTTRDNIAMYPLDVYYETNSLTMSHENFHKTFAPAKKLSFQIDASKITTEPMVNDISENTITVHKDVDPIPVNPRDSLESAAIIILKNLGYTITKN